MDFHFQWAWQKYFQKRSIGKIKTTFRREAVVAFHRRDCTKNENRFLPMHLVIPISSKSAGKSNRKASSRMKLYDWVLFAERKLMIFERIQASEKDLSSRKFTSCKQFDWNNCERWFVLWPKWFYSIGLNQFIIVWIIRVVGHLGWFW